MRECAGRIKLVTRKPKTREASETRKQLRTPRERSGSGAIRTEEPQSQVAHVVLRVGVRQTKRDVKVSAMLVLDIYTCTRSVLDDAVRCATM